MHSASATITVEVNSLTNNQLDKYSAIFKKSKEELAALILLWGFSNLPKIASSDCVSFLTEGFSNPPRGN